MNIGWNPYPDHVGHAGGGGCFRCHNPDLVDEAGRAISNDCTLCHSFFAFESASPYYLLQPVAGEGKEAALDHFLRDDLARIAE